MKSRKNPGPRWRVYIWRAVKGHAAGEGDVLYTHAASRDQAECFAHKRRPGWTVTRVVKDTTQRRGKVGSHAFPPHVKVRYEDDPGGNPTRLKLIGFVERIEYVHADDAKRYRHEFGAKVQLQGLPDGSLRIWKRGRKLYGNY